MRRLIMFYECCGEMDIVGIPDEIVDRAIEHAEKKLSFDFPWPEVGELLSDQRVSKEHKISVKKARSLPLLDYNLALVNSIAKAEAEPAQTEFAKAAAERKEKDAANLEESKKRF